MNLREFVGVAIEAAEEEDVLACPNKPSYARTDRSGYYVLYFCSECAEDDRRRTERFGGRSTVTPMEGPVPSEWTCDGAKGML